MSKFSKRHYEFIAMTIAGFTNPETRKLVARVFAERLQSDNPRFKEEKFLRYCRAD